MSGLHEAFLRDRFHSLLFTVKLVHFFAFPQWCSEFSVIYKYSISVANSLYR